jgi:hypothetical protein
MRLPARLHSQLAVVALICGCLTAAVADVVIAPTPANAEVPAGARYVPLTPTRILDSRQPTPLGRPIRNNETFTLQVAGVAGVPSAATSVAINLTATATLAPGYVSAVPAGRSPTVSSVNFSNRSQTIANFAIVPLGPGGRIDMFMAGGAHLIIDALGYWEPVVSTATAGRYLGVAPTRVLDTRSTSSPVAAGGTISLTMAGNSGVAADATAVAVNITAADAAGAGFVTVWPLGSLRPNASTLNMQDRFPTPNTTIIPLSGGGISLFTSVKTHLIVDVQGYVTGASAPESTDGLFVALPPTRVVDTRSDLGMTRLGARFDQEFTISGKAGLPPTGVSAVAANVTATDSWGDGYLSVYPSRTPRPNASNINFKSAGTVAGYVLSRVGDMGTLALVSYKQTDVLIDIAGYFTGTPLTATAAPPIACADLMTYFHDPAGFPATATALTYTLAGSDLSGRRPDWSIDTHAYVNRIAPGCQYIVVARDSVRYPGYLDLVKLDSPLESNAEGDVLVEGVGWSGLGISPDAKWIHFADGSQPVGGVPVYFVSAINVITKSTSLVATSVARLRIGGVDRNNHPWVAATHFMFSSRAVGPCQFGTASLSYDPCLGPVEFLADDFDFKAFESGPTVLWQLRNGVGTSAFRGDQPANLAPANAEHPRWTYDGSATASITGIGVVLWSRSKVLSNDPNFDRKVLNGTTDDYPEFSTAVKRNTPPIPALGRCALSPPGC